MAAMELEWIPETLYNTAISAVVDNYSRSRRDIRSLPENIQFDVYYKVRLGGLKASALTDSRETAGFMRWLMLLLSQLGGIVWWVPARFWSRQRVVGESRGGVAVIDAGPGCCINRGARRSGRSVALIHLSSAPAAFVSGAFG